MNKLTVRVEDKRQAKLLKEMLSAMKFVKEVAMDEEYELTAEQKKILNKRLALHRKNPGSGVSINELFQTISSKHGFKNNR